MEIRFTNAFDEAVRLRDQGFEPIECAFGGHGSVMGELAMDHHGAESWRAGVAIRACTEAYGARRADPRFVVTGTPDADAVLAIVALSGLVPRESIDPGFYELVDRHDRDPIGLDLERERHGLTLLAFNQSSLPRGEAGFRAGVARMSELLTEGLPDGAKRHVLGQERSRKDRASKALRALYLPDGREITPSAEPPAKGQVPPRVALVHSTVWGFDVWYRWAPVVVSYSTRLQKVTIGCPDDSVAEVLFGEGGLHRVFAEMGQGWGGRASVGGSPRGVPMSIEDAARTASTAARLLVAAG